VIREPFRFTARGRHNENVVIAVVLPCEGDPFAVGRELGDQLVTGMGGQAAGLAAARGGNPQIFRVNEHDLVVTDVGISHQPRLRRSGDTH